MNVSLMKLTIAANYSHGVTIGGERRMMRLEYLRHFLEKQDPEYFEDLAAEIGMDRGCVIDPDSAHILIDDYLEAPSIKNRGLFDTGRNRPLGKEQELVDDDDKDYAAANAGEPQAEGEAGDQDDEDEQEPEAARGSADPPPPPSKMTKAQLFAMYKGKGPHAMNLDILNEEQVRAHACIIVHVTEPLHRQYQSELKAQTKGLTSLIQWAAARANGEWVRVVYSILAVQSSWELFAAMRCAPHCDPPATFDWGTIQDDIALTQDVTKFAVELAANSAWAQMLYTFTLPLASAALLSRQRSEQRTAMRRLQSLVLSILIAEKQCSRKPTLIRILEDLAYQQEPFVREIMFLLRKGKFDIDSDEVSTVRKLMLRFCGSSSSTKEILESTFGHLADLVSRSNKNKVVAPHLLWLYTTGSPYVKASGMTQSLPGKSTWARLSASYGMNDSSLMQNFFKAFQLGKSFPLPTGEDVQFPKNANGVFTTQWRHAGPLSHYKSSAAAAYMIHDSAAGFPNAAHTWAGNGEYLTFPVNIGATAGIDELKFMFNFKVAEDICEWRRVLAKALPPACIPVNFSYLGSIFQVDSKDEWILRGALRDGVFLTIQQLRSICVSLKVVLPGKKQGSGKNGNVVKKDIALCLLKHVFPDLAENEGELTKLLKPLMGWNSTTTNVELLSAISELDVDNQDAFAHVRKEAMNQFEEALFGKGKQCGIEEAKAANASKIKEKTDVKVSELKEKENKAEVAERKRQFDLTPPSLKLLLPGGGTITATFWARYHPQKNFFRTDYPTSGMAVKVIARGWKLMNFATLY
eukprot:s1957_g14.t1